VAGTLRAALACRHSGHGYRVGVRRRHRWPYTRHWACVGVSECQLLGEACVGRASPALCLLACERMSLTRQVDDLSLELGQLRTERGRCADAAAEAGRACATSPAAGGARRGAARDWKLEEMERLQAQVRRVAHMRLV